MMTIVTTAGILLTSLQPIYAEKQSKQTEKQITLNPSQKEVDVVVEKSEVKEGEFSIEPYENGKRYTITVNKTGTKKLKNLKIRTMKKSRV